MGEAFHTIVRDDADIILRWTEAAITPVAVAGFAAMKAFRRGTTILSMLRGLLMQTGYGFVMAKGRESCL
jgi:3-oxoacyl-(acyl-carrier-protein) synthase